MAEEPQVQVDLQEEDDDDVQVDFMKLGKKKKKSKKDGKKGKKAMTVASEEKSKFKLFMQPSR